MCFFLFIFFQQLKNQTRGRSVNILILFRCVFLEWSLYTNGLIYSSWYHALWMTYYSCLPKGRIQAQTTLAIIIVPFYFCKMDIIFGQTWGKCMCACIFKILLYVWKNSQFFCCPRLKPFSYGPSTFSSEGKHIHFRGYLASRWRNKLNMQMENPGPCRNCCASYNKVLALRTSRISKFITSL